MFRLDSRRRSSIILGSLTVVCCVALLSSYVASQSIPAPGARAQQTVNLTGHVLARKTFAITGVLDVHYEFFAFAVDRDSTQGNSPLPVKISYEYFPPAERDLPDVFFDYSRHYELRVVREPSCDEKAESWSYPNMNETEVFRSRGYGLRYFDGAPTNLIKPDAVLPCYILRPGAYKTLGAEGVDDYNLPEGLTTCLQSQKIFASYELSASINPFYLRGDFDGDGRIDHAILIKEKSTGRRGVCICAGTAAHILGAGKSFLRSDGHDFVDFGFASWRVFPRQAVRRSSTEGAPPSLRGEAILAQWSDEGSGIIYWDGARFAWYRLGL